MAALVRKNSLEQARFELHSDRFSCRGLTYRFEDVIETAIYRQRFELKVVLVGSDFTHSISAVFSMRSGENIQLTEQPTWFSTGRPENVDRIQHICDVVSQRSFDNRVNKYTSQLETNDFFVYAGWRFFPTEGKLVDESTKRAYAVSESKFLRSYGFLEVRPSEQSIGAAVQRKLGSPVGIATLRDTDVFFALLSHYFNLRWG